MLVIFIDIQKRIIMIQMTSNIRKKKRERARKGNLHEARNAK